MIFMEKSISSVPRVKERDFSFLKGFFLAAASFFLALSPLFGRLSPFPAALVGALSGFDCVAVFFGSVIGFAAADSFELAVPYIGAMTLILAVRLIINGKRSTIVNTVSAAVTAIVIFIANLPSAQGLSDIFTGFAFGAVSFIGVMALCSFINTKDKPVSEDNIPLALSGGIIYTLIITAFTGLQAEIFNTGIFLSAMGIVLSPYIHDGISAAAGILSAVGITIADGEFSGISVLLALSALISSLLGRYGRITRACALIFALGTGVVITGITTHSTICLASSFIGAVLSIIIPERLIPTFRNRCYAGVAASHRPFYAFGKKLEGMSCAVKEMNCAIKKTAAVLDNENLQDPSQIYISAADHICSSCRNNMYCWGSCYNRSADIMNRAVAGIRQGRLADESMLDGHFAEICTRRRELAADLNRRYAAYCSAQSAARKVGEMRTMLSSQLSATERMLKKMSDELCNDSGFDMQAAKAAERVLEENGITDAAVTAMYIENRLTIDAYGRDTPFFIADNIEKKLAMALRKEFDPPLIAESGDGVHITLSERSMYDAQIKTFARSKSGNSGSGDCFDCFNDGKGNVYMILSDGMGSGSRARIDSAFSCSMLTKMLKAGIDFDAAMEMLNNSLMVKSADESFATLDVCRINLYTGEISLYKAGSASTFVRCGKSFSELSGNGIPFGVSFNAEYSEKRFTVSFGDIVIMASDGAEIDKAWLSNIVLRDKNPDLGGIISTIGEALRLSAEKGKEDDITVIGVKIIK